jgi:hypothetical protein
MERSKKPLVIIHVFRLYTNYLNIVFLLSIFTLCYIYVIFVEKYELGVSNAWNATKLFINDDIPPINEFKAR